jgi:BirA family biotin operon repressor/biotin-[acetyl-CoA-carboxylase] ligase
MITWSLNELLEVDSTQNVLRDLAVSGASEGTVVVARRQTSGRGRHGRSWVSPEGGLYMSLLLRPPPSAQLRTLTLAASLAVVRGIRSATGLDVLIGWPNDIIIGGKKLAGVIAESTYIGQRLSFVTIGIGVNCNSTVSSEVASSPVTSLAEEVGKGIDLVQLRRTILDAFADIHDEWLKGVDVIGAARSSVGTIGRRVAIATKSGGVFEGVARDIEPNGDLVLQLADRKLIVHAADVELLREA